MHVDEYKCTEKSLEAKMPVEQWRYGMAGYVSGMSGKKTREGKQIWLFKKSILYYLKITDENVLMKHLYN